MAATLTTHQRAQDEIQKRRIVPVAKILDLDIYITIHILKTKVNKAILLRTNNALYPRPQ